MALKTESRPKMAEVMTRHKWASYLCELIELQLLLRSFHVTSIANDSIFESTYRSTDARASTSRNAVSSPNTQPTNCAHAQSPRADCSLLAARVTISL